MACATCIACCYALRHLAAGHALHLEWRDSLLGAGVGHYITSRRCSKPPGQYGAHLLNGLTAVPSHDPVDVEAMVHDLATLHGNALNQTFAGPQNHLCDRPARRKAPIALATGTFNLESFDPNTLTSRLGCTTWSAPAKRGGLSKLSLPMQCQAAHWKDTKGSHAISYYLQVQPKYCRSTCSSTTECHSLP